MPPEDDVVEASPAPDATVDPAPVDAGNEIAPTDPASAPDTDTTEGDGPNSLEEAIRSVITEEGSEDDESTDGAVDEETDPAATPPDDGTPALDKAGDDEPEADELSDEDKSLKPNAQKRISTLLHQRKDLRTERDDLTVKLEASTAQLEEATPLAENMRTIRTFMDENAISGQDMSDGVKLTGLFATQNFAGFLDAVKPYVDAAQVALGQTLPADLQTMVDDGRVSEDDAKRLSMDRAALSLKNTSLTSQKDREAARADQAAQTTKDTASASIKTAVDKWQVDRQAQDPDYGRKQPAIMRAVKAHMADNGGPKSAQDAVEIMEKIYTTVLGEFQPPAAPLKATRKTPDGMSAAASPTTNKEPKSVEEAMQMGLQAAHQ